MRAFFVLMIMMVTGFYAVPVYASTEEAKVFITKTGEEALAVIRDKSIVGQQKQLKLESMFVQTVDINWISRFVLGKYARQVAPTDMSRYQREYETFLVKHYTSHFTEYTGETLNIIGARDEGDSEYTVSTEILRPRQQSLSVDYRVRQEADASYKIIDIIFEGVSMITTQRSEFSSVVGRQGMDYLIKQLISRNSQIGSSSAPKADLNLQAQQSK